MLLGNYVVAVQLPVSEKGEHWRTPPPGVEGCSSVCNKHSDPFWLCFAQS